MNQSLKKALEKIANLSNVDASELIETAEKSLNANKELRGKASNIVGGNTWGWAELRQDIMYKDELYSMVATSNDILQKLTWSHGQIDSVNQVIVPVIGEMEHFNRWAEIASGDTLGGAITATHGLSTAKATLTFKKFKANIIISREELDRSIGGATALWNKLQTKIVEGMSRSITSFIINGDSAATSTLNQVTSAPTRATDHRSGTNGIRKVWSINGILGGAEAYSRATMKKLFSGLDNYTDDPTKLLRVMSPKFADLVRFDPTYSDQNVYGVNATNTKGWYVLKPEGVDAFISREYPNKLDVNGNVDTAANPVHLSASLIYAPAVQYAFGRDMVIVTHEHADGFAFEVQGYFAFDIVNNAGTGVGKTVSTAVCLA